jgi:hypothetical protein
VPLALENAKTVVFGKFNPYIFSPQWLNREGIWTATEGDIRLSLGATDGVQFQNKDGSTTWQVNSDALMVSSVEESGALVGNVLETLNHTPVSAISTDLLYTSQDWDSPLVPTLGDKQLSDLSSMGAEIVMWSTVFHHENTRVSMEVTFGGEGVSVLFSHFEMVANAELASQSAKRFAQKKKYSETLIKQVLEEEIKS